MMMMMMIIILKIKLKTNNQKNILFEMYVIWKTTHG
jgi:hypothetical protein